MNDQPKTFDMTLTNVDGGPCPSCGHRGELHSDRGVYGGQRTLTHIGPGGQVQACTIPMDWGKVETSADGVWSFAHGGGADFRMSFRGVHGGPCPVCGRCGELMAHHGFFGGMRTIVHRDDDGVHGCSLPEADGMLFTGQAGQPVWTYKRNEEMA